MEEIFHESEQQVQIPFIISGIYLVIVGVTGGLFNIIAFIKAYQVNKIIQMTDDIRIVQV